MVFVRFGVVLGFSKNSGFYDARMKLMRDYGYTTESNVFYFLVSSIEPCVSDSLLYFARVFVISEPSEECRDQLEDKSVLAKAWDFLRKRFELVIISYGNLEKHSTKGERNSTILRLKRNEVQILERALRYCICQIQKLEPKTVEEG